MDTDDELARLEAAVYSRAGSAESAVDFIDPVTGETVRATPSEHRLRALRAERAEQVAGRGARLPEEESASTESLAMPALPPGSNGPPRRRFVLPMVAAAAFAVGVLLALLVTSVQDSTAAGAPGAGNDAGLLIFDFPPLYPDIPVPDLGDEFVPDSIRNISGTSAATEGFGVYLGRQTGSELYCLIVHSDEGGTAASCSPGGVVRQRGLWVETAVTVRFLVAPDAPVGDTVLTAKLTSRGEFSMSFPPTGPRSVAPPKTTGTTLAQWASGPTNDSFSAEIDAHGEGLVVALDCTGEGAVTVDLGDGNPSVFHCTAGAMESFQAQENTAHGALDVTISAVGNVTWGLTIAGTPLTEPAQG